MNTSPRGDTKHWKVFASKDNMS